MHRNAEIWEKRHEHNLVAYWAWWAAEQWGRDGVSVIIRRAG